MNKVQIRQYTYYLLILFFLQGSTAPVGQVLLIFQASRSHSDTPHSVELLWTSDQSDADTST